MLAAEHARVGYVLKMFPRLSETFILNEILAHETAGWDLEIFSLRPPDEAPLHLSNSELRSRVTYVPVDVDVGGLMQGLEAAQARFPSLRETLDTERVRGLDLLDLYQAVWLAQVACERGITHLHAHFASVSTTVARLASRISGIPYSFTAHAKDIFHTSVSPEDLDHKLADAAFVATISDYNLSHLRRQYASSAGAVFRIYNGLDLQQFRYAPPDTRPPRIVAVGRLIEKKGFADLIDACAVLASKGRKFTCEIIGPGPLERDLLARTQEAGLSDRVHVLGALPQHQVMARVQGASVLAAPCVQGSDGNVDGLPTVLLEAMALGTPCVSTDVTGIPEVLIDRVTGLMTPPHNPDALASAISVLLDDAGLRVRLAEAARRLMERDFEIHRNTAGLRELFTVVAGAGALAGGRAT